MDHMPRREPVAFGDLGVAGGAAAERTAFGQKLWPRGAMDRAVDAAAAEKRRVRGVDDGVNAQCRDVGNDDFQPRRTNLARGQGSDRGVDRMPLSANSCCSSPAWNISRMMSQPPTNSPLT